MKLSEGVEWSLHCCTVLGALPDGVALTAGRLAEFHDVPHAYLAKHLQAMRSAGIVVSSTGRNGGYRLGRPADEISMLDVVLAVDGDEAAFRCGEIRQRGPSAVGAEHYVRPCGIARAMWYAETAWRDALHAVTIADLVGELGESVSTVQVDKALGWFDEVLG